MYFLILALIFSRRSCVSTGSGQSSTFHESVDAAQLCMPTNAVKWSRMTATSSSSRFASSPSLLSCCSFGKLIRLSNAFSFSLRLYSVLLSIRSCSRCLRSCSRRTASSWRRAAVSASRAIFSLFLMIATIKSCRVARGTRRRSALRPTHSRHSPGARPASRVASTITRLALSSVVTSALGKSSTFSSMLMSN